MSYKRVLTVQDISCVGQCSITVALPIISATGSECCILPSAVLSTHTGGFKGFTFRDLTDDIPGIVNHWKSEGLKFDCLYTGYLGSQRQIEMVEGMTELLNDGSLFICDPAMADNGILYKGFDDAFVKKMSELTKYADIILPNITEASLMTGIEYKKSNYDESYILSLCRALAKGKCKTVVMTGVAYTEDKLGIAIYSKEEDKIDYYFHEKISKSSHGTGDVYASAFVGSLMQNKSIYESAAIAADFTVQAIKETLDDESHFYGVKFEKAIPLLIEKLK